MSNFGRSNSPRLFMPLLVQVLLLLHPGHSWVNPIEQVRKDYLALTRRITIYHILLPPNSDDVSLALKQKIRNNQDFVLTAFARAAKKYSRDDTTSKKGGLIGELVPQGYCKNSKLEEYCFTRARIGIVEGPIDSDYGQHLVLVSERTNCPKLDGGLTKLVPTETGSKVVPSEQVGTVTLPFVASQIGFWIVCLVAGGFVAELAAALGERISD